MTSLKRWRIKPSGSTISISQISRTTLSILQDRDVSTLFLQTETPPPTPSTTMELQEDGFMTNASQIKKSLLVCGSFSLFLHLLEPRVKIYTTGRIFFTRSHLSFLIHRKYHPNCQFERFCHRKQSLKLVLQGYALSFPPHKSS